MSAATAYRPVDFRKRRGEATVPRPLAQWQDRACVLASEAWNKHLPSPVKWTRGRHDLLPFSEVLEQLPDPGVGFVVSIGETAFPTLWSFAVPHSLSLTADLLGNLQPEWPEPRSLTAVEESLMQLLMHELAWALGEAWPGRQSIACRMGAFEPRVARSRLFGRPDMMITTDYLLETRLGDAECRWIIPQAPFEQLAGIEWPQTPQGDELQSTTSGIERLAVALPITLTVKLGEARLPMAQLADLGVGDVVVLDQFITEPVLGDIHGVPKFRGFPGRIGPQSSFEIVDILDSITDEPEGEE